MAEFVDGGKQLHQHGRILHDVEDRGLVVS